MAETRPDVELRIPADSAFLSVLRRRPLVWRRDFDFTLDDIEDLRIAVDEACAIVLPQATPGSDLSCSFFLSRDAARGGHRGLRRAPAAEPRRLRVDRAVRVTTSLDARVEGGPHGHPVPHQWRERIAVVGESGTSDITEIRARSAELFAEMHDPTTSPERRTLIREDLVRLHLPLVEHLTRRFLNRGEPYDDLLQVGTIGLIKAVDRFDTDRGVEFSTYATPTIVGEIKRHFRDKGWAIRVPRRLQELRASISAATAELTQDLGRSPTVSEIARKVGVTDEEVIEGLESANAYATLSLDATDSSEDSALSMLDAIGEDDEALEHVENRESIKPLLEQLDPREAHPHPAVLPRHDPVADRGRDRRLADARVPAADQDAGAPARTAHRGPVARRRQVRPPDSPAG